MRNTLADLNNILFEQMERLQDDDLKGENLETDKQIVKEEKERRARTGIRWGAGYIKVEPRPVEKFDLSEYYTIPFNNRKRERVVNDE
jgi:hypothetical protein